MNRRRGTLINDYEEHDNKQEGKNIYDISGNRSNVGPILDMDSSQSSSDGYGNWDKYSTVTGSVPSPNSVSTISPRTQNILSGHFQTDRLVRLIYTSKMCLIYNNIKAIQKIVNTAHYNNDKLKVGGELFWTRENGRILQILEGKDDAINIIYKKICEDERHQDVKLLHLQEITSDDRQYQKWDVTVTKKMAEKPTLQDWKITSIIGIGAYGTVVAVENNDNKEICAMKLLSKKRLSDKAKLKLVTERNFMEQLKHPFLVELYHTFEDPLNIYFIMQFAARGDLYRFLSIKKQFSSELTKYYMLEMLCGMLYIHKNGIVYGDIKLENILIDNSGHIILTDFGISTTVLESQRELTGTIVYFSPELITDKLRCQANDTWALGIIFYEMLVGNLPWQIMSRVTACRTIMNSNLQLESSEENDFLQSILIKSHESRPSIRTLIKNHQYLADINWNDIYKKKFEPPDMPEKINIHTFGQM